MAHYALPLGAALDAHLVGVLTVVLAVSVVGLVLGIGVTSGVGYVLASDELDNLRARDNQPEPQPVRLRRPKRHRPAIGPRETVELPVVDDDTPARLGDPKLCRLLEWPRRRHTAAPETEQAA